MGIIEKIDEQIILNEAKINPKDALETSVRQVFLNLVKHYDPKKAKKMAIDSVSAEAEKIINSALKKALAMG